MHLYPFKSHFLDLDGLNLHFVDEGEGTPVVMLHGNPTWSFSYRELILALRDSYRVIAPDHIGCGLSDKPNIDRYRYTLQRRVEDLDVLLAHLGLDGNLTLVMHDWGGMIGMAYASSHPDEVQRFVVMNTAAFHLPETKRLPFSLRLCRTPFLGAFLVRGINAFSRGAARFCCTRASMSKEVRKAYLSPYDSWANRIALHQFVKDIPLKAGDPSYPLLSDVENRLDLFVERPMLICWGERDFVFDGHFLEEWIRRFPRAEVHRFADAGHYVLEDASEEIVPLVREFLKRHSLREGISS